MNAELGRWLQTPREEQGYSQEGMARVLGVSVSAVRKWEQSLAEPRFKMQVSNRGGQANQYRPTVAHVDRHPSLGTATGHLSMHDIKHLWMPLPRS